MLNQADLNTLKRGDPVDHFLLVRKCESRMTKANKPYLFLELGDRTFSINSNMWDNFDSIYPGLKPGDIVRLRGTIDDYQGALQIKISAIRPIRKSDKISPVDFLMKSKRDPEEMKTEFFQRINKICDPRLKCLMQYVFNDDSFNKFSYAPAGKSWHHSYLHGLLEHTLEIIKICDLMCDLHNDLNRDLLISGAMLHDIGKIDELNFSTNFEYTDKGKLVGHIVLASLRVNEEIKKIPDFPEELKTCLLHLILSHQGKLEYASPVVPKTLEAIALYQADELSAKVNAYKNAIANDIKNDNKWTKYISLISTELFNHGIIPLSESEIKKSLFD